MITDFEILEMDYKQILYFYAFISICEMKVIIWFEKERMMIIFLMVVKSILLR